MAEVLLFHHAHGQTEGFLAFAQSLRDCGHVVHTPDLYEGKVFAELSDGVAHAEAVGFGNLVDRGVAASAGLPFHLVYAGFSLGVMPAQALTQNRPGARGALLFHSCAKPEYFGGEWPHGVPTQIHAMDADDWFVGDGDIEVARTLVASHSNVELLLYPGAGHLFADSSLPDYDEAAAALLTSRVLTFLGALREI